MSKESFVAEGTARALPIPCTVLTQMDQKEDTKNLHELIELGSIHDRLEEWKKKGEKSGKMQECVKELRGAGDQCKLIHRAKH